MTSIRDSNKILVASHINPDGDTIGSLLALGLGLERLNKQVIMVSQDGVPDRYKSLPGANRVLNTYEEGVDLAVITDYRQVLGETVNYITGQERTDIFPGYKPPGKLGLF